MPRTKGSFEDNLLLLGPENSCKKFVKHVEPCETAIMKGVIRQLRRWPSDLFFAFLAACLVIGSLVFLVFITVAFCLPTVVDNRVIKNLEIEDSDNVYFLKLENRTWSTQELCYIETAARNHPELNIYLINLWKDGSKIAGGKMETKLRIQEAGNSTEDFNSTREETLKNEVARGNSNIRNIDLPVEKLFKRSKLWKIVKNLNDGMLEMAAKAQLIWNYPGVVLNPNMYCNLESVERVLCRKRENCVPDNLATIEPKNDIQATSVPCQAFVGFVMHEISKIKVDGRYSLKEAVEEYCPRLYHCPEIRILDLRPKCPREELNCPTVYSRAAVENGSVDGIR